MPRSRVGGAPWATLLEDPDLRRWHQNVARGSQITADVYLRRLGATCERLGKRPSELLTLKEKELRDLLLDFVSAEEKKRRAGSYIQSSIKAVKSWLLHNGIKLTLPVKIKGAQETPTLREERTPTQDELRTIFLSATPRDRVSCVLMAHAGLRPEVLGNYLGNDGLRLADLPELRIRGTKVRFEKTPTLVSVRPELSKAAHRYFTFLSEEGCSYLVNYLEERIREGERLKPETDLIHPKGVGAGGKKSFIRTINIGDGVRSAIRAAGFPWRPYVLRAYFDTQLLLAESKGKVAHDYRVFWMGHKGSMEARYTTNKGRLPENLIDDMREAYKRCEPFLSTAKTAIGPSEADLKRAILAVLLPEDEVAKLDVTKMSTEEVRRVVTERLQGARGANLAPGISTESVGQVGHLGQPPNGSGNGGLSFLEAVVSVAEVKARLAEGWMWVAPLGSSDAILRRPG